MNKNLLHRLAAATLTAVAVLGFSAASASAWETKPWTGNEHLKVVALPGSSITVVDDETFGANEVATYSLSGTVFGKLSYWKPKFTHVLSRCAGDEVRAELWTEGVTYTNQVAHGTAYLKLYEGTSCQDPQLNGVSDEGLVHALRRRVDDQDDLREQHDRGRRLRRRDGQVRSGARHRRLTPCGGHAPPRWLRTLRRAGAPR